MVVGAGVAGLGAAVRLATRGHDIVVVDPSPAPGGPMAPIATPVGVFAASPNRLVLPAPLRDLFARTGTALDDAVELRPAEPMVLVRAPGLPGPLALPGAGVGACVQAVTELAGPAVGAQWRAALARGGQRWAALRDGPSREEPDREPAVVRALARACALAAGASGEPGSLADAQMLAYLAATFGVWQVTGGLPALAAAIADRAEQRGARLWLGCPPAALVVQDGRVTGVRLRDGRTLPADKVLVERRLAAIVAAQAGDIPDSPGTTPVRAVTSSWPGQPADPGWLHVHVRARKWPERDASPLLVAWSDGADERVVQVWVSSGRGLDPIAATQWALGRHGVPAHVLWAQREPTQPAIPDAANWPAGLHLLADPGAAAGSELPWAGFAVPPWTPPAGQVIAGDVAAAAVGRPMDFKGPRY